jgi:hypothetical protein
MQQCIRTLRVILESVLVQRGLLALPLPVLVHRHVSVSCTTKCHKCSTPPGWHPSCFHYELLGPILWALVVLGICIAGLAITPQHCLVLQGCSLVSMVLLRVVTYLLTYMAWV